MTDLKPIIAVFAFIFGAVQAGDAPAFHRYSFDRLNAMVNAYAPVNDITVACGAGAIKLGFPVITNDHDDVWAVPKSLIIYDDYNDWILSHSICYTLGTNVTQSQASVERNIQNSYNWVLWYLGYSKENPSFYKKVSNFVCPSAADKTRKDGNYYAYNALVYGVNFSLSFEDITYGKKKLWKQGQVKRPARFIFMADSYDTSVKMPSNLLEK